MFNIQKSNKKTGLKGFEKKKMLRNLNRETIKNKLTQN